MGIRSEVLEMDIIDALETLILIRMDEEQKYNNEKRAQATEFDSMLIAAMHVSGGDNPELSKIREAHVRQLTDIIGEDREQHVEKEMSKYQWPKHVLEALEKQDEGR